MGRELLAITTVLGHGQVTQGGDTGWSISGVTRPVIQGQVTSPVTLSTAAAQSEPSGLLTPLAAPAVHQYTTTGGAGDGWGVPGVVGAGCTLKTRTCPGETSAYTEYTDRPG